MRRTYILGGLVFFVGLMCLAAARWLMDRVPAEDRPGEALSEQQRQLMVETKGRHPHAFIDEICQELRAILTPGDPKYRNARVWHGGLQKLMCRILDTSFPMLRPHDQTTGGTEYLEDVAQWVFPHMTPEEVNSFHDRYPHVAVPGGFGAEHGAFTWLDSLQTVPDAHTGTWGVSLGLEIGGFPPVERPPRNQPFERGARRRSISF